MPVPSLEFSILGDGSVLNFVLGDETYSCNVKFDYEKPHPIYKNKKYIVKGNDIGEGTYVILDDASVVIMRDSSGEEKTGQASFIDHGWICLVEGEELSLAIFTSHSGEKIYIQGWSTYEAVLSEE